MELKKITAIIPNLQLGKVEQSLRDMGVKGITVSHVKGYGEHKKFFSNDWLSSSSRIEIFTLKDKVDSIVQAILESASTGVKGDGLIAVLPVEKIYRIRTKTEATASEI
jgi:nitrogen regulatory protein P-II 1